MSVQKRKCPPLSQKLVGFTLIETLVALVITALTLITLLSSAHFAIKNTAKLHDHFGAQIVAQYTLRQIQLGLITVPQTPYRYSHNIQMLNKNWLIEAYYRKSPLPGTREINVEVNNPTNKNLLIHLFGFR